MINVCQIAGRKRPRHATFGNPCRQLLPAFAKYSERHSQLGVNRRRFSSTNLLVLRLIGRALEDIRLRTRPQTLIAGTRLFQQSQGEQSLQFRRLDDVEGWSHENTRMETNRQICRFYSRGNTAQRVSCCPQWSTTPIHHDVSPER